MQTDDAYCAQVIQSSRDKHTCPQSFPGRSSCRRSGRPPRRSAAGPGLRFARWRRRHPACGSPEESSPPFPGSPSLRYTTAGCVPCQSREGFISCFSLLATLAVRGCFRLHAHAGSRFRFAPSLTAAPPRCVGSSQGGLSPPPSVCAPLHQAPRGGG